MKQPARLLGVDYGSVRVGLALSDPEGIIASPLLTYIRKDEKTDARFFRNLVEEEDIAALVVGLPMHTNGTIGEKAREAQRYGAWLEEQTSRPVHYWDERFTTVEAESHLLEAGLTKKRRQNRRDQVAAQIILQSFLEQENLPSN